MLRSLPPNRISHLQFVPENFAHIIIFLGALSLLRTTFFSRAICFRFSRLYLQFLYSAAVSTTLLNERKTIRKQSSLLTSKLLFFILRYETKMKSHTGNIFTCACVCTAKESERDREYVRVRVCECECVNSNNRKKISFG